jgi:anti-sigma factor RsiW
MAESSDLTCQLSVELLPKYLDDDLPEAQTLRLEQHIMICPGCRTYLEQLRRTIAAVSRLRIGEPRHQLWADIAAHLSPLSPRALALMTPRPETPRPQIPASPPRTRTLCDWRRKARITVQHAC